MAAFCLYHSTTRPSLYEAFHIANAERTVTDTLGTDAAVTVVHETHRFRFDNPDEVARYLATTPKYQLTVNRPEVAARLDGHLGGQPFEMTSTVTYVAARIP